MITIPQGPTQHQREGEKRIALLIDGDNAQYAILKDLFDVIEQYGKTTIKRIYGDWSSRRMSGWKRIFSDFGMSTIQNFPYVKGKNATDIALVIDAMDVLHSGAVDGFCIVSSDSDYTGLANRLRESGLFVMGVGEQKTPDAFVNSCEVFIFAETLLKDKSMMSSRNRSRRRAVSRKNAPSRRPPRTRPGNEAVRPEQRRSAAPHQPYEHAEERAPLPPRRNVATENVPEEHHNLPVQIVLDAFEEIKNDEGTALLSAFGKALKRQKEDFDIRDYDFTRLFEFIKATNQFEIVYVNKRPKFAKLLPPPPQNRVQKAVPRRNAEERAETQTDTKAQRGRKEQETAEHIPEKKAEKLGDEQAVETSEKAVEQNIEPSQEAPASAGKERKATTRGRNSKPAERRKADPSKKRASKKETSRKSTARKTGKAVAKPKQDKKTNKEAPKVSEKSLEAVPMLKEAFKELSPQNKPVVLSQVGKKLKSNHESFDYKDYDAGSLLNLIQKFPDDFELIKISESPATFVRLR